MSEKPENPAAFPNPMIPEWQEGSTGMTLRDYFAGQALAGIMANPHIGDDGGPKYAYYLADAMLAQRHKDQSS